ncbi:hypothetical protein [Streptomyces sp. S.PNR 29]|nr:hypothetical protein [Streptomyces sp. S.PNR 29]MDN0199464.1 hypothetical protein [Streptomyces sp. S.PNR 29]
MPEDPYAVMRALLRAEAVRSTHKPRTEPQPRERQQPAPERKRD